jgi:DNA polymerase I
VAELTTPVVYLVDASFFVFRAYYSIPDHMADVDGNPVNAVYGFARFICDLVERENPAHVAIAFDESLASSFRTRIYPQYKANREPAPPALKEQFARCRELCEHLGISTFGSAEYEADDIIGTLATRMRAAGFTATVVTRDKDLSQLIRVGDEFWDYMAGQRLGYADIANRFGVQPEKMADFLALTGDAVDNIPGVPGIGPKTATALLQRFDSLDHLYDHLDQVAAMGLRGSVGIVKRLVEHRHAAYLARELTRIACDMPIASGPSDLRRRSPNLPAIEGFYDRAGFGPMLRRQVERIHQRIAADQSKTG